MEQSKKSPVPLSLYQFFPLWVGAYLLSSLLGDVVLGAFAHVIDSVGGEFVGLLVFLAITGLYLGVFYWMQKRLLQRFFYAELHYWIVGSFLGWAAGFALLFTVQANMYSGIEDRFMTDLRTTSFLLLASILVQWWILRNVVNAAWLWVAVHLAFILLSAALVEDFIFTILLFSNVEYSTYFETSFFTFKFMAVLMGVITGSVLLWLRYTQERTGKHKK